MIYSNHAKSWLLVVCETTDCNFLDSAIQQQKSSLHKLGDKVYLGAFHASPPDVYQALKDDHGVSGEVRWIELPIAVVTDSKWEGNKGETKVSGTVVSQDGFKDKTNSAQIG